MPSSGWRPSSARVSCSPPATSGPYDAFLSAAARRRGRGRTLRRGGPRGAHARNGAAPPRGLGAVGVPRISPRGDERFVPRPRLGPGRHACREPPPAGALRRRHGGSARRARPPARKARRSPDFRRPGFFNYVLGLRNPFWLEQFFPGHLDPQGEARAVAVLDSDPPDALLSANVLAVGEGARAFGEDYLNGLAAAARSRYRTAAVFGPGARPSARIGDPQFFVEISTPLSPRWKTGP